MLLQLDQETHREARLLHPLVKHQHPPPQKKKETEIQIQSKSNFNKIRQTEETSKQNKTLPNLGAHQILYSQWKFLPKKKKHNETSTSLLDPINGSAVPVSKSDTSQMSAARCNQLAFGCCYSLQSYWTITCIAKLLLIPVPDHRQDTLFGTQLKMAWNTH